MKQPRVLIGLSGGIALYKSAALVSRLVQNDCAVSVIMTKSATRLIAPKTFEALTGRSVRTNLFAADSPHPHIDAARAADVFCIAPATANIIGKIASGIADDLLSTTVISFNKGPILIAPAMNYAMWHNPAVQRNVRLLTEYGYKIIGPKSGHLSCGESGDGRMAEPDELFDAIFSELTRSVSAHS